MSTSNFLNYIFDKLFFLPNHPKKQQDTSVVLTLDKKSEYFPVNDIPEISFNVNIIVIIIYITIWSIIITFGDKKNLSGYLVGFVIGLLIIIFDIFCYTTPTVPFLLNTKKGDKKIPRPFIMNLPSVKNIKQGSAISKDDMSFNPNSRYGDYKVLINNKNKMEDTDKIGYIYPVDTFLKQSSLGTFIPVDLGDYIEGKNIPESVKKKDLFDVSKQEFSDSSSNTIDNISRASYYLCITMITWAVYVTTSPWGSIQQLYWNILAFMTSIIGSSTIVDTYFLAENDLVVFIKKYIFILAISFGITSVYIS